MEHSRDNLQLTDRELLLKLLWTVEGITGDIARDRAVQGARLAAQDLRIDRLDAEIKAFGLWKAKVVGWCACASMLITLGSRLLWK